MNEAVVNSANLRLPTSAYDFYLITKKAPAKAAKIIKRMQEAEHLYNKMKRE